MLYYIRDIRESNAMKYHIRDFLSGRFYDNCEEYIIKKLEDGKIKLLFMNTGSGESVVDMILDWKRYELVKVIFDYDSVTFVKECKRLDIDYKNVLNPLRFKDK